MTKKSLRACSVEVSWTVVDETSKGAAPMTTTRKIPLVVGSACTTHMMMGYIMAMDRTKHHAIKHNTQLKQCSLTQALACASRISRLLAARAPASLDGHPFAGQQATLK